MSAHYLPSFAIENEGGVEAVTGSYGSRRLVGGLCPEAVQGHGPAG